MKTFWEFLQIKEGGMWANPAPTDGKGTKRPPQKDLFNSRYPDGGASMGGGTSINTGIPPQKKSMKK